MDNIGLILTTLFGGGVIGTVTTTIINKFADRKKNDAETDNINIKNILEIDARMNERLARLEERVAHLEDENNKLKNDKLELKEIIIKYKAKYGEL